MEEKKVTDLSLDELISELIFIKKMKKHWYAREEEVLKELERRSEND